MPTLIEKPVTVAEDKQLKLEIPCVTLTTATDLTKNHFQNSMEEKVISIVPSIDTGICSTKHITFNKVVRIDDTVVITISVDLPFAQTRWCGAEGLKMPSCFLTTMIIVSVKLWCPR